MRQKVTEMPKEELMIRKFEIMMDILSKEERELFLNYLRLTDYGSQPIKCVSTGPSSMTSPFLKKE